jgi:hypothetical protein
MSEKMKVVRIKQNHIAWNWDKNLSLAVKNNIKKSNKSIIFSYLRKFNVNNFNLQFSKNKNPVDSLSTV